MKYFIKLSLIIISSVLLLTLFSPHSSLACSVFCIDKGDNLIVGRNYDWGFGEGMVVVNKKNQTKTALRYWDESKKDLARWTSKYGSITFVQYGRDIAFGGMNEAGLVVNELWLEETEYPVTDSRVSLSIDQVVQYILDNFRSVDEIAVGIQQIRFRPTPNDFTKIHFFATDSSGQSIIIEFLHGEMVIHSTETMPVKVMTNDTNDHLSILKAIIWAVSLHWADLPPRRLWFQNINPGMGEMWSHMLLIF